MTWRLEIKTKDGDRPYVDFDSKDEAKAELERITPQIGKAVNVTIGGELVIRGDHIYSAQIYEYSGPGIG
jgi:hypothetical protein